MRTYFKVHKWDVTIAVICLISGILLAWNLQVQEATNKNKVNNRKEEMVQRIKSRIAENKSLEHDIEKLKVEVDKIQKDQVQGQTHLKDYQQQLEKAKHLAGLSDVTGSGVIITLTDVVEKGSLSSGNPNDDLVHYEYLLSIVNALKLAGADAISLSGSITTDEQRIVTTSDIECAGTVIDVNKTGQVPPYKIKAIGDPDKLEQYVKNYSDKDIWDNKLPVTIEKKSVLTIKEYKGSFTFPYTKINKEGEK